MDSILQNAIQSAQKAEVAFTKFISANDAGETGGHQSGFYIPKSFCSYVFEEAIIRNTDYTKFVEVKWQSDFTTQSRFKYYGSKNECHFTKFQKGFPFLSDDNVGNLLIICKKAATSYEAFVLQKDDEIEDFFVALNLSVNDTNKIIPKQFQISAEDRMYQCFITYLKSLDVDFPSTQYLSNNARRCYSNAFDINVKAIIDDPDGRLLDWLDAEFQLFKTIESDRYSERIKTPFANVEELVEIANTILNRRKSRAGKSLEHHLAEIFVQVKILFESQVVTEYNKKPDFIFPGKEAYLNPMFDENKLCVLASKTTCKDRWRQVLNEADRIKTKHLFTLQQGISTNQLEEMFKYNVQLVVPRQYLTSFPATYRDRILTLDMFVKHIQKTQL